MEIVWPSGFDLVHNIAGIYITYPLLYQHSLNQFVSNTREGSFHVEFDGDKAAFDCQSEFVFG